MPWRCASAREVDCVGKPGICNPPGSLLPLGRPGGVPGAPWRCTPARGVEMRESRRVTLRPCPPPALDFPDGFGGRESIFKIAHTK